MTASDDLFAAIEAHDADLLATKLATSADPNGLQPEPPRWRPLHAAIEELEHGGPIDALIILLRAGADIDGWDGADEATPLLMAVYRGQQEAIRLLLGAGANPNVVSGEGDSPLRWCAEQGEHDLAATLLRCGATATIDEAGGPSAMSALGRAAYELDLPMVELLLAYGADPEAQDGDRQVAREHLPPRPDAGAAVWDRVAALLARRVDPDS